MEFQKQVEVLDGNVEQVNKMWNPNVAVEFRAWLE